MECVLLGWPPDGPALSLDHEAFSYAGKFVTTNTGKAIVREGVPAGGEAAPADDDDATVVSNPDDAILAAAAFNEDRTDADALWIRYLTVRSDRRGEGIGPRLVRFVLECAEARGYERVRIAVNNPFAYEALYRAGFGYTGRQTGIAELVLERPDDRSVERYRDGLAVFDERDTSPAESAFVRERLEASDLEVPTAPGGDATP